MRLVRQALAVVLSLLFAVPHAQAQSHVVSSQDLDRALLERAERTAADREAIRSLLQRPDVRDIARRAGLSVEKAQAAVSLLEGEHLQALASQARQAQNELAGGASTVVISTTTIILVLLIVILVLLLAD